MRLILCSPDQLVLPDDPAFLPDLGLLDFSVSFSLLDPQLTLSLSPKPSPRGRPEEVGRAAHGHFIPTSEAGDLTLPGFEAVAAPAGLDEAFHGRQYDEDEGLLPEVDFEFDAEGNIRTVGRSETAETGPVGGRVRLESDSAASARVRQEHAEGLRARRNVCLDTPLTGKELTNLSSAVRCVRMMKTPRWMSTMSCQRRNHFPPPKALRRPPWPLLQVSLPVPRSRTRSRR